MRRKEKEITDRTVIDWIISRAQVCRLGLCKDNLPYVVPVNFGYDGSFIYFHTAVSGMKIDYLRSNPLVCFELEHAVSVVPDEQRACGWTTSYYSVIGWGTAAEMTIETEKACALSQIMRQYSERDWSFDHRALERLRVWRIEVEKVTGKGSSKPEGAL